jgi:xanthine dehydrogenase molybdopterin-binding subunit B
MLYSRCFPFLQSTAASTGSDNNAPAVVSAAHILRERLERMEDGIVYKEAQNRSRGLQTYVQYDLSHVRMFPLFCPSTIF